MEGCLRPDLSKTKPPAADWFLRAVPNRHRHHCRIRRSVRTSGSEREVLACHPCLHRSGGHCSYAWPSGGCSKEGLRRLSVRGLGEDHYADPRPCDIGESTNRDSTFPWRCTATPPLPQSRPRRRPRDPASRAPIPGPLLPQKCPLKPFGDPSRAGPQSLPQGSVERRPPTHPGPQRQPGKLESWGPRPLAPRLSARSSDSQVSAPERPLSDWRRPRGSGEAQ